MPLRTGRQYLAGLKDGREVWLGGQRVQDVTTQPEFAGCLHTIAEVYDLQHQPEHRELLTALSPATGEPISRAFALPGSTEDLVRRRQMIEFLMRRSAGSMGRLPEYMATLLMGIYNFRDVFAEEDERFGENIVRYFEYVRDNDLCLTHAFADPARSRRHAAAEGAEYLHVVERRPDGIVIRGAKAVATLAPFADEFMGLTSPRAGLKPEEVIYFAVPVATPGLRIICREPLNHGSPDDHPLAARYDEMDGWVVFHDVFVPFERVFFLDRADLNQEVFTRIPIAWAYYHILVRTAVKAEVIAGLCAALSAQPEADPLVAEAIRYLETMRAFILAAERSPVYSSFGLAMPEPAQVVLGRLHAIEGYPRMLQVVRDLAGSGLLMSPSDAQLHSPELGPDVARFLGVDEERIRLLRLAWDFTSDSYGMRQLLFELHNAGTFSRNQERLLRIYDTSPYVELAKRLAGVP
ncbi:MAG TPA: 4-hydroxyphenylacetate 3-hydroxylase N-terminal domain-containing protein [Chloroflexota bacterium]|nr:4-hydroxyphenylacetate 3-hydroxylase N-terminal domain-containing protein [Chloroflexota bacterium]